MRKECFRDGINERFAPDESISRLARDAPSAVWSGRLAPELMHQLCDVK